MFLAFLFKWAIALTLFYSLFGLLLRRETFYRINRFVLLGMLPLSAWLATLRIETTHINVANRTMAEVTDWMEANPAATAAPVHEASAFPFTTVQVLIFIYYAGLAIFVLQYLVALIHVIRIIRKSRRPSEAKASIIPPPSEGMGEVLLNDAVDSPFSWFRWIVISSQDLKSNGRIFLAHESAHVSHGHSWDMLLCEFCVRLQWFNPFAWQLREDLRAVHEFQADRSVIHAGCNVREYNMLLIDKALGAELAPVANALTQGELKTRIRMMYRKPSPWIAMLKVLYIIPLALFALAIFAKPIAVINIVNAKDVDVIAQNVKTLANPNVDDAILIPYEPEKAETEPAPRPEGQEEATPTPAEFQETSQETGASTPPSEAAHATHRPSANTQGEGLIAGSEPFIASNAYQRERAEKAIADYITMSVNPRKTSTYVLTAANITLDSNGRVTDVSFPEVMSKYTWFDADAAKACIRTLPRDLTRDYIENLDNPSESNILTISFHVYK